MTLCVLMVALFLLFVNGFYFTFYKINKTYSDTSKKETPKRLSLFCACRTYASSAKYLMVRTIWLV